MQVKGKKSTARRFCHIAEDTPHMKFSTTVFKAVDNMVCTQSALQYFLGLGQTWSQHEDIAQWRDAVVKLAYMQI